HPASNQPQSGQIPTRSAEPTVLLVRRQIGGRYLYFLDTPDAAVTTEIMPPPNRHGDLRRVPRPSPRANSPALLDWLRKASPPPRQDRPWHSALRPNQPSRAAELASIPAPPA